MRSDDSESVPPGTQKSAGGQRKCPILLKDGLSWDNVLRQLAYWHREDNRPIQGKLKRYLLKAGCSEEFFLEQPHTLVTVVLPKGSDLVEMYQQASGMRHKWILEGSIGSLEGWPVDNPHFHLLTIGRSKKQNIVRCLSKRFKVRPEKVDVQLSTDGDLYTTRSNYVKGLKDPSKMDSVLEDREYRAARGVPDLVTFFS